MIIYFFCIDRSTEPLPQIEWFAFDSRETKSKVIAKGNHNRGLHLMESTRNQGVVGCE